MADIIQQIKDTFPFDMSEEEMCADTCAYGGPRNLLEYMHAEITEWEQWFMKHVHVLHPGGQLSLCESTILSIRGEWGNSQLWGYPEALENRQEDLSGFGKEQSDQ